MDEKVFFQHDGVKVTNARFVVDAQTFAMSNVTSIKPATEAPSRLMLIVVFIVGLMIALSYLWIGLAVAASAALQLYKQKTYFHIFLNTSGGETKALSTLDKEYFNQVIAALNQAIVHRG